jgi:predicted SnoaL-like aldol condensation-catalyzing enzyme
MSTQQFPSPEPATPQELRSLATTLFDRLRAKDVDGIASMLHDEFVSHNPNVAHDPSSESGRDAFVRFLRGARGAQLLSADVRIQRIAVDGDLVWLHNHLAYPGGPGVAAVDILRVSDGLVAEHWDVVQPIPEALPHPHGMF